VKVKACFARLIDRLEEYGGLVGTFSFFVQAISIIRLAFKLLVIEEPTNNQGCYHQVKGVLEAVNDLSVRKLCKNTL